MLVAESVADRVHEALARAVRPERDVEFFASGSIGISLFPQDALDAETLLKNADAAMYQSKRHEPGGYVVFATSGEDPIEKLSLTTRLRRAVEQEHWVLHYQPVVNLADGTVEGVEALIRWQEPNGGIVPPGEFIPLAEELGLIEAIGDWVIDEIARQHARLGRSTASTSRSASTCRPVSCGRRISRRRSWGSSRGAGVDPQRGGRRDHGVDGDGRSGPHPEDPVRAARVGPHARDRRLRDRLLVARAAEAPAGRRPEDRPRRSSATSTATPTSRAWCGR